MEKSNVMNLYINMVRGMEKSMMRKGIESYIKNDDDRLEIACGIAEFVQFDGNFSGGNPYSSELVLSHLMQAAWKSWASTFADERKKTRHGFEYSAEFDEIGKVPSIYDSFAESEILQVVESLPGKDMIRYTKLTIMGYTIREIAQNEGVTFYRVQSVLKVAREYIKANLQG